MNVKLLRYLFDSKTKKKTILEELDVNLATEGLTEILARAAIRQVLPAWSSEMAKEADGWPYLYKFRDDRGKVFRAQKPTGDAQIKGSFHHVWEHIEIWGEAETAKPIKAKKPKPRAKRLPRGPKTSEISSNV